MTDTKIILQHLEKMHDDLDAAHRKQLNRCRRIGFLAQRTGRSPIELAVETGYPPTPMEEAALIEGFERAEGMPFDPIPDEWKD